MPCSLATDAGHFVWRYFSEGIHADAGENRTVHADAPEGDRKEGGYVKEHERGCRIETGDTVCIESAREETDGYHQKEQSGPSCKDAGRLFAGKELNACRVAKKTPRRSSCCRVFLLSGGRGAKSASENRVAILVR